VTSDRFLYHLVPEHMNGSVLRPLSALAATAPHEYERLLSRYQDDEARKRLPDRVIPPLECRWQDVVHLAPLHPRLICRAWKELGVTLDPGMRSFRIPVEALADVPTVVYDHPDRFEWFDRTSYRELTDVPDDTKAWYATLAAQGRCGAWLHKVPHVLVKGEVDVEAAGIVEWSCG
jgi:hypothetical protein